MQAQGPSSAAQSNWLTSEKHAEDVSPTLLAARGERQLEVPALRLSCKHPKDDSMQVCNHSVANGMMARAATRELWCSG